MKIACLGWGSLIWKPESLLIQREWFKDGPFLPIEYSRQSNDDRLTLVIDIGNARLVRTLWALMATDKLAVAKKSLQVRENIPKCNFETSIGAVNIEENTDEPIKLIIQEWAKIMKIDAVIWTSLPPKFNGNNGQSPSLEEAIIHLKGLNINKMNTAKEYIRRTPTQIDTDFRREFEKEFGWTHKE